MTTDNLTDVASRHVVLTELAIIDASGSDAVDFLQGQLSNDIAALPPSRATLAGYCNPKGRLLALPVVIRRADDSVSLVVAADLAESFLQRLRMFVMRADVSFTHRSDLLCIGIDVSMSADSVGAPAAVLDVSDSIEGGLLLRWHDASSPAPLRRYLRIVSRESPEVADALPDETRGWRLGDISAGLPRIVSATREALVPQMVNLQLVDGLSFRKGCYPGQEIVARMQYLGKLKRRMHRFRASTDRLSDPGDALALASSPDAEGGLVIDAVVTDDGTTELLAVIRVDTDLDDLRLHGVPMLPLDMPYAFPESATETAGESA